MPEIPAAKLMPVDAAAAAAAAAVPVNPEEVPPGATTELADVPARVCDGMPVVDVPLLLKSIGVGGSGGGGDARGQLASN